MKLTVLQEDLHNALSLSSRFVSVKASLPILGNVLLLTESNSLSIMATNLESSIVNKIGATVSEEGEVSISAKQFGELISHLPSGKLSLSNEKEELHIATEGFSGVLPGLSTNDFPIIPRSVESSNVTFKAKDFTKALGKVLFAASSDETRPILTGVLFIFNGDSLVLVSSDGFRLSQIKIAANVSKDVKKVILPKTTLSEVLKISQHGSENITLDVREQDNQVVFGIGQSVVASRIVEGDFPPFEKIIPQSSLVNVRIDKETLFRAIKIASVFARDSANIIRMNYSKNGVEIEATSVKGGSQKTQIEAKVEGGEVGVSFNYRFLEDFLNVCESDEIRIELTDSQSPGVFRDLNDGNYLHLVMPVRI